MYSLFLDSSSAGGRWAEDVGARWASAPLPFKKRTGLGKLVFLGGTAANNSWRKGFIAKATGRGVPASFFFDPVVANWNEEAQRREEEAKVSASHLVFYIADPQQEGNPLSAYSMVEATMALYDKADRTVVVFDTVGISGHPLKAITQVLKVLKTRFPKANIFATPDEAIIWLCDETVAKAA